MTLSQISMNLGVVFQYLGYGIVFVLMISVLVAAHELGHYLFARMFNMGVEEFAIGFGKKPLVTWMRRSYVLPIKPGDDPDNHGQGGGVDADAMTSMAASLEGSDSDRLIQKIDTPDGPALKETTNFTIRPWPLGGFVRIKGMMPAEDGSEVHITGGFYNKSPYARFLVLLAGPLFSVIAGIGILTTVYMFDGKSVPRNEPVIGGVSPKHAAAKAGIVQGDRVISIDGQPITTFYQMVGIVTSSQGHVLHFEIDRKGVRSQADVVPEMDEVPRPVMGPDLEVTSKTAKNYRIGVGPDAKDVHLAFVPALVESAKLPVEAASGLIGLFRHPSEFSDTVSGPATMVSLTASAVGQGIWKVLLLSALLSISVGIFNLLPAPPLDGGQMAMAVAEMFRGGKRLSIRSQAIASTIGLTFVGALVVGAFVVDIQRLTTPKDPPAVTQKAPKK